MISSTEFALLTERAPTASQPGMAATATKGTPGRGRPRGGSRLGKFRGYEIALAFCTGRKVEALAAEYGLSVSRITQIRMAYGVRARNRRHRGAPDAQAEATLRQWARDRAAALRREADGWEALAELE